MGRLIARRRKAISADLWETLKADADWYQDVRSRLWPDEPIVGHSGPFDLDGDQLIDRGVDVDPAGRYRVHESGQIETLEAEVRPLRP